jgi:CheY-like chemotaxis protein
MIESEKSSRISKVIMIGSIFLIDDNEVDIFINRSTIQHAKYNNKIIDFLDAESALDYLKSIKSNLEEIPTIIFLDINMPIMNGFLFLKRFESLPLLITKKTKIVMLSSSTNPSDIKESMANPHVIKFLNKPLTAQKMKDLLN